MEQAYLFDDEEWRDIDGYEGLYQVSNWGRVKRLCKDSTWRQEHVLVSFELGEYLGVKLCSKGKMKTFSVHRLVAKAFLHNPDNLPQVNHKDENKHNNQVWNLEWCDLKYNMNYGTRIKRISEKQSIAIEQLTMEGMLVKKWKSIMDAGRNGYSIGHICNCCKGKRHSHKGYVWRYAE